MTIQTQQYKTVIVTSFIVFIFSFFSSLFCLAQDTMTYCQTQSPWISNCYLFIKTDTMQNFGVFENQIFSDDLQRWRGRGRFTENKKTIRTSSFYAVHTQYEFQRDSVVEKRGIADSTQIAPQTFYKKKGKLVQYYKQKGWFRKRREIIFEEEKPKSTFLKK